MALVAFAFCGWAHSESPSLYWRIRAGRSRQAAGVNFDTSGRLKAVALGKPPVFSREVPLAVVPSTLAENHGSIELDGGSLRVTACPELNLSRNFTVEFWCRFGDRGSSGAVLVSMGKPGVGNWHIIYQSDGSVRACIYGSAQAFLFDAEYGGPVPGVWYHVAATYEDVGSGRMRVRAYVNGQARGSATGPALAPAKAIL